jgi:putative transposase
MSRPRRLDGFSYVGCYRYSLTTCTYERRRTFLDHEIARQTIEQFRTTLRQEHFSLLAYCVMPDHMHALLEGQDDRSDFRRCVKMAKQCSGAAHALTSGTRLWQKGYYEHVLRDDEDSREVAFYIIANPVRAGLVESPDAYAFSGSDTWSIRELIEWVTKT